MLIREAQPADVPQLMAVRLAVLENRLTRPELITAAHYLQYLTQRGKGWVAEAAGGIVGFAVVDLTGHNIWALFLHPDHAGRGIGRALHDTMLSWYFRQTTEPVWLGTAPGTRAERFYRQAGWRALGLQADGEVRFEMRADEWSGPNNVVRPR